MSSLDKGIVVYSSSTTKQRELIVNRLSDIGFRCSAKVSDLNQLMKLELNKICSVFLFLLTDDASVNNKVLSVLRLTKDVPLICLVSQHNPLWEQDMLSECDEAITWQCSKEELNFRIRKTISCSMKKQNIGQNLFVNTQLVGNSPAFLAVLDRVNKVSKCDIPVLIDGETGTGKELIARAVHYLSERKDKAFIASNCGAIPDHLIENEFFGHKKGAYTDATESSEGIIAQAEGGTLFLDEIENLSSKGQITFLRFLDNMEYTPLGSSRSKKANVRIVTATNETILSMVEEGRFRKDLYYRVNIMNVLLPPLRERVGDIKILAEHFIRIYQMRYKQPDRVLHPSTIEALCYYDWPGNIRELENLLHREFLLADDKYITISEIESKKCERRHNSIDRRLEKNISQSMIDAKKTVVNDFEVKYLTSVLSKADGNISKAARLAGKERRTFTRLLQKYSINFGQSEIR